MPVQTRYRIDDTDVPDLRSFHTLKEIPQFLLDHKSRLASIGDVVALVSNRAHLHPTYVRLSAFHRHRTPYAAIDALAPPLAEFFERTDILPIIDPIFDRYKENLKYVAPELFRSFTERGVLIPSELHA